MQMAAEAQPGDGRRILIAFIVATAFVMQGIDSTLLIIAIPTISNALSVNPLLLHLAVTAYLLSLALFMPVSGWFADRIGNRTMFCVSLLLFTLGSVCAGIAPEPDGTGRCAHCAGHRRRDDDPHRPPHRAENLRPRPHARRHELHDPADDAGSVARTADRRLDHLRGLLALAFSSMCRSASPPLLSL